MELRNGAIKPGPLSDNGRVGMATTTISLPGCIGNLIVSPEERSTDLQILAESFGVALSAT